MPAYNCLNFCNESHSALKFVDRKEEIALALTVSLDADTAQILSQDALDTFSVSRTLMDAHVI